MKEYALYRDTGLQYDHKDTWQRPSTWNIVIIFHIFYRYLNIEDIFAHNSITNTSTGQAVKWFEISSNILLNNCASVFFLTNNIV